jgi:hypothetical protein
LDVAVAVAAAVVAETGSESQKSAAAGNLAWLARREALWTEATARRGLSCCCSWRSERHSRTGEGRRLGEWERLGETLLGRGSELLPEDFEGSSGEGRSFERVERDYCIRCRTGVLGRLRVV